MDIEEGIRFTPFNMRDELEEGHFDADGMYIFKRTKVCICFMSLNICLWLGNRIIRSDHFPKLGLKIRRSPVQIPPKTNFSIMIKLPVKSTGK